jgi:methylglyoxal synthase
MSKKLNLNKIKSIAFIAHDNKKYELLEWVKMNLEKIENIKIYATNTTGNLIKSETDLDVICLKSGLLGGDQQIASKIIDGEIGLLMFFWDPLKSVPHDCDVKSLMRIATHYNVPVAYNQTTADFIISSPLFKELTSENLCNLLQ